MKYFYLLLSAVYAQAAHAQHAENLFRGQYARLALEAGSNKLLTTNTYNPSLYQWTASYTGNIGLTWNFRQRGNMNYKISAIYSAFNLRESVSYNPLNPESVVTVNFSSGPYTLLLLPLEAEYYAKLTGKTYLSFAAGPEFTVNPLGKDEGRSMVSIGSGTNSTRTNVTEYARSLPVYLGFNAGVSIGFATRAMLLKLYVKYHYQFEDYIYQGDAVTRLNGATSFSQHRLTGNYAGFGITVVPNKSLFK